MCEGIYTLEFGGQGRSLRRWHLRYLSNNEPALERSWEKSHNFTIPLNKTCVERWVPRIYKMHFIVIYLHKISQGLRISLGEENIPKVEKVTIFSSCNFCLGSLWFLLELFSHPPAFLCFHCFCSFLPFIFFELALPFLTQ